MASFWFATQTANLPPKESTPTVLNTACGATLTKMVSSQLRGFTSRAWKSDNGDTGMPMAPPLHPELGTTLGDP